MRASAVVARPIREAGAVPCAGNVRQFLPWLVAVSLFMENLDATIVNTAVPSMSAALHVAPLSLKGVLTSYTLSLAVFIPISGWMADRFGTKRVFATAITVFSLGSLACGLAINVPMLVASRVLQGIGGAMMTPVGRIALVRSFPRSELMTVMQFVVIPALIGPLLGPVTGGLIVHWLPWRTIFLLNLPFGLIGLWMVRCYMPDFRDPAAPPLDRAGFLLFGGGIGVLSYVLEVFGEHGLSAVPIILLTLLGVVLLAAYGWHAHRITTPMLRLTLLRIRTFRVSVFGGFITRLGFGGMPFLLPLLYQLGMGFPAWKAGLLTMPQALAAMGMKVIGRKILARLGHRTVLIANTIAVGVAISSFTFIGPNTSVWCILPISFVMGFLSSLQFTSMNTLVYADVDDREASQAGSIASTAQQMSLSFGVALSALIVAWFLGGMDQTVAADTIPALHKAFLTMGSLTVISSLVFWTLSSTDGNNVSNRVVRVVQAR
ncbi:MAG TPA: DHA2 family efflux MFS transporter permease subunit [Chthoniobacter sp.]